MKILYKCKKCDCDVTEVYGSGTFCSAKCARSYSTINDIKETKILPCKHCGIDVVVGKRTSPTKCVCDACKLRPHYCERCGDVVHSKQKRKHCDKWECQSQLLPSLIEYFGFNQQTIGTIEYLKEFHRIREILSELYLDDELSSSQIAETFNHPNTGSIIAILQSLQITTRNKSVAAKTSIKVGTTVLPHSYQYKHGWHTTWQGDLVFYRSSYELTYAMLLDSKQVPYKMEHLRISYWDNQLMCNRIAIPDFYLPCTNTIVEIKSEYTLDIQNMIDKKTQYEAHGYNFILIVDGMERII